MALTFDPTDPARMTPEQRVDELAAILAAGVQFERNLHDKANDPEFWTISRRPSTPPSITIQSKP
jgi:hypothetical protein